MGSSVLEEEAERGEIYKEGWRDTKASLELKDMG